MTRSILPLALLLAVACGCGSRTLLNVPEDGGAADRPSPGDDQPLPFDDGPTEAEVPVLCGRGLTLCDGACVDLRSDSAHCGACGSTCGPMGTCSGGSCVGVACPSPLVACGGVCVDASSDPQNCGACGNLCPRGQSCQAGLCRSIPVCGPGQTLCDARCVDPQTDAAHCGGCNRPCPAASACVSGACRDVPPCPTETSRCGAACVDTRTNVSHCGACGNVCLGGLNCVEGVCRPVMFCPMPLVACEPVRCFDLRSDPAHCGRCGNACSTRNGSAACAAGSCRTLCNRGFADCDRSPDNGCEVELGADPANCGACGNACAAGATCQSGACRPITMPARGLRIDALLTTGCRTAEHAEATGDDRGGIAWAGDRVFYTGDLQTVGFDAETLAPVSRAGRRLDGVFGELSLGLPFTLASNRTPLDEATSIVDAVMQVSASGAVGMASIPLSSTILLDRRANDVGVFAGPLRALVTQGSRAWLIDGTAGLAAPRVMPFMIAPIGAHTPCESYAFWGVLEVIEGQLWVAYVRDGATIVRQNIVTGAVQTIATFTAGGLSDMCSFTVAPSRGRWYFHHEGTSQFARGDETIGYCDARLTAM